VVEPAPAAPAAEKTPAPIPEAPEEPAGEPGGGGRGLIISIAIVIAAMIAAIVFRTEIIKAFPASEHIYQVLGLDTAE
jgi:hypothetical protein